MTREPAAHDMPSERPQDPRRFRGRLLYLPALALLVGYVVPVFIVANNLSDFQHLDAPFTLLVLLATSLAGAALAALVSRAVAAVRALSPLFVAFRWLFFFCLLTGLVLPLTAGGGQTEVSEIPVDVRNAVICALLATAVTLVTPVRFQAGALVVSLTVLLGNGLVSTVQTVRGITPKGAESLYQISSSRNVFVLSFDGLTRDSTLEVIEENPALAAALSDFTLFTQAVGSAVATATSIMSELAGNRNLKREYPTEGLLYRKLKGASLISNALSESGYQVSTYGTYASSFSNTANGFAYGSLAAKPTRLMTIDQTIRVFEYAVARVASSHAVFARPRTRWLAGWISHDDEEIEDKALELQTRIARHRGRDWDVSSILTVLDLERYLANLTVAEERPVAQFLHFTYTHYPVDFDRNCSYRSDDPEWYQANQNRQGAKAEIECALYQFTRFLDTLRRLGAYEDSLIVLKSDHGKPVRYNDPQRYEGFSIRGHTHWGFTRYTPFLAVKRAGPTDPGPSFDDRQVTLGDLAYTICNATVAEQTDCARFNGYDLLDPSASIPPEAGYWVYLPRDRNSDWRLDTHAAMELPRGELFFTALNDRLTSELLTESPPCDRTIAVNGGVPYNNGATDQATWVRWSDGPVRSLKVRTPQCRASQITVAVRVAATEPLAESSARLRLGGPGDLSLAPVAVGDRGPVQLLRFDLPPAAREVQEVTLEITPRDPVSQVAFTSVTFHGRHP